MCVVINPGKIKNNANSNPEDEISYILLLDSLKLHGKLNVLKNIRRWLNNVYEDKYTKKKIKIQKIKKTESCTMFDEIQIYQPDGK